MQISQQTKHNTQPILETHCLPVILDSQVDSIPLYSLAETKSYVPISSCLLNYIITTTNLSSIEKIFYILADCLASINANSGKKRKITLSAEDWAERLGYSISEVYNLQKSIEKLGFFKVIRQKNEHNQNNRNTIIPTIPNNVFKYLSLSSKKNITNEYYYFDSSKENKRVFLDRTDYFFKLNYDLLKIITGNDKLTATQKVIWLDLYIRAYGNHKITQNLLSKNNADNNNNVLSEDSFYSVSSYSELEKRYSCSNGTLSKNLNALKKAGFITKRRVCTLKNSLGGQRKDKLFWKITVMIPENQAKELANLKDRSIKKLDNNNHIPEYNNTTAEIKNSISISSVLPDSPVSFYSSSLKFNSSYSDYDSSYNRRNLNILSLNIKNSDYLDTDSKISSSYSLDLSNLSIFYNNSFFDKNITNLVQTTLIIPKLEFSKNKNSDFGNPKEIENEANKIINTTSCKSSNVTPENNNEITKSDEYSFKYFYPLSDKLATSLNRKANREFSTNFTNQLLLKFINKYPDKIFANHYCFYSYMIKALRYEKHNAYLVSHDSFYLSVNISDEQKEINRKQKYLAKIESAFNTTTAAHLEKKIVARFGTDIAYSLLTECQFEVKQEYELEKEHEQFNDMIEVTESDIKIALQARKLLAKHEQNYRVENEKTNLDHPFTREQLEELGKNYEKGKNNIMVQKDQHLEETNQIDSVILHNVMVVSLSEAVTLTNLQKKLLEKEIKFIHGNINIIYKQLKGKITNYNDVYKQEVTPKQEQDYSPLWQKIRAELKYYFGENWQGFDKAWFSKLEAEINQNTGDIVINAPTNFIRDWVKNKFLINLKKACESLNLNLDKYDPIIVKS